VADDPNRASYGPVPRPHDRSGSDVPHAGGPLRAARRAVGVREIAHLCAISRTGPETIL